MNNALRVFQYEERDVRAVTGSDGEPWFVAADVCGVLEIQNPSDLVGKVLDEDEKGIDTIYTLGGPQEVTIISEAGLYSLVLRSRKPEAKKFKRWITHDVIPAIRKHGGYLSPEKLEEALTNPDVIIRLATNLKAEQEKRAALEHQAKADAPRVLFSKAVETARTSILVGDLAKILRQNGVCIGQRRLFEWLRENGFLIKSGSSRNMPMQWAMERGFFEIKETAISRSDGTISVSKTTKITGRGQVYIVNRFLGTEISAV